jgi:hypothetical protein
MVGKYMFGGGSKPAAPDAGSDTPNSTATDPSP